MKDVFTKSPEIKEEYCAQVVKIGELKPIEGSDFLVRTLVSGISIVVRKDEFKTGDYAIYCKNETSLNSEFLSINNLYDRSSFMLNENHDKVIKLNDDYNNLNCKAPKSEEDIVKLNEIESQIKSLCGYINKHGRIKMLNLRKVPSYGILFKLDTIAKWKPQVKNIDLSKFIINDEMGIGINFDTICSEKFIQVYIPPVKEMPMRNSQKRANKRQKKIERFERINKEDFKFHYDKFCVA